MEWAAGEGWNPGLDDADCFYDADPDGFLIGRLDGKPIATISVVKYGADFGFLGFYIVAPEYRGQGYGYAIWQAGMASLKDRNVGLDGVVDQQDNYRKSGFKLAWRNARYQGLSNREQAIDGKIVSLSDLPLEKTEAYDRPFFPADRSAFIRCWINRPHARALGWEESGNLKGIGVIRQCRTGFKIGPLFADNEEIAERLYAALVAVPEPGHPVFLDVPETNPRAVDLARRHGMDVVFETARMYTGQFPELPIDRLFGITTFELG